MPVVNDVKCTASSVPTPDITQNRKDLNDISEEVKTAVKFITVSSFDEVMNYALEYLPSESSDKKLYQSVKTTDIPSNQDVVI